MGRKLSLTIACSAVLLLILSASAFAEPQSIPNGPWIEDTQTVQINALMSNEELEKFVGMTKEDLIRNLDGKMKVLDYLVNNNINTVEEVGRVIANYYLDHQSNKS